MVEQDNDEDNDNPDAPGLPDDAFISSDDDGEEEPVHEPSHTTPKAQPQRQVYSQTYQRALGLGKFMTPQAAPRAGRVAGAAGRYSVDGGGNDKRTGRGKEWVSGFGSPVEKEDGAFGGARRVRLEAKWKVGDIVVPGPTEKSERDVEVEETPVRGIGMGMGGGASRARLTEEERKVRVSLRCVWGRCPDYYAVRWLKGHPRP